MDELTLLAEASGDVERFCAAEHGFIELIPTAAGPLDPWTLLREALAAEE